jgi:hypothetical protein
MPGRSGCFVFAWTNLSIYVISVKITAAGLIFWPFSCKLKDNHACAVQAGCVRQNYGPDWNIKLQNNGA